MVPSPSASARVFDAVSVSPCCAVPVIVTLPLGGVLGLIGSVLRFSWT